MTAIATHSRQDRRARLLVVPSGPSGPSGASAEPRSRTAPARSERSFNPHWSALVIRLAVAADDAGLRRLAHMDSARPLSGPTLLAEQGGSVIAALSLDDGAAVADPFVASADAVAMLRVRAAQLHKTAA